MMRARVKGLQETVNGINEQIIAKKKATRRGLIKGGLIVQRGSQERCPVDTGNLKASAFTIWNDGMKDRPEFTGKDASERQADHAAVTAEAKADTMVGFMNGVKVVVGHSAAYAIFVHEDLEASHMKQVHKKGGRRGETESTQIGEAKYLENSLKANQDKLVSLIAGEID